MKYIIFILFIILSSCTTYHFEPIKTESVEVVIDRGRNCPLYIDNNIEMVILPDIDEDEDEIMLHVTIKNISNNNLYFKDTDFYVENSKDSITWKPIKAYTSAEYLKLEKSRRFWEAFGAGLSAGFNSASANRGSYQSTPSGQSVYVPPTSAQRQLANSQNQIAMDNLNKKSESREDFLQNNLFYSKDLRPGENYYGIVFVEEGNGDYYKISCNNELLSTLSILYVKTPDN